MGPQALFKSHFVLCYKLIVLLFTSKENDFRGNCWAARVLMAGERIPAIPPTPTNTSPPSGGAVIYLNSSTIGNSGDVLRWFGCGPYGIRRGYQWWLDWPREQWSLTDGFRLILRTGRQWWWCRHLCLQPRFAQLHNLMCLQPLLGWFSQRLCWRSCRWKPYCKIGR